MNDVRQGSVWNNRAKLLAFYLPQYHPIPENDEWWGKGFTEWTNVVRAKPRYKGHYQPRLPADLGFYDLRLPEVREAQADLARSHGVYGFCYYHYWFNGRRLLERPFAEVLGSRKPDFPFCLCWANENWTRSWSGGDRDILLAQRHSLDDDRAHIRSLLAALRDDRYIRIGTKPLLLVYRTEILPDAARMADIWREEAQKSGIGDLFLARVESFIAGVDPRTIGFDAAVEFAPDWRNLGTARHPSNWAKLAAKLRVAESWYLENRVCDYDAFVERMLAKPAPPYRRFRCVTPGFDNSARRAQGAVVLHGSTPAKYGFWLNEVIAATRKNHLTDGDHGIVFVNAWNEWGEGNYLEPDLKWGHGYLEATYAAMGSDGIGWAQADKREAEKERA